jgi:hypothetical protein
MEVKFNVSGIIIIGYSKKMGVITIKQAKNHVKQLKICQFFQTYLCNVTLMSF